MKKTFFQNLLFLLFLNLLIKPLWILGVDRSVQNMIGHESYGLYFVLFNFSFIFNIILDVGITNYNSRIIAQKPTLVKTYLTNILLVKLILIGVYFFITLVVALGLHLVDSKGFVLLFVLCFNQALSSVILYLRSNISAMHYFKTDSILSVLDKLLMIIFFGILIYAKPFNGEFNIEWFVYSQTLSYLIALLVCVVILFTIIPRPTFHFEFGMIKTIWKESYPLAILVLLMSAYARIDGVMLKQMLGINGNEQAGIYATAYRLMDAANQFGFLFAALLLPIFSRMIAREKPVGDLLQAAFKTIFIFSFLGAVICLVFRREIMELLYPNTSDYSALTLGIIMFSLIGSSAQYIFGTLLTANRNLKTLNVIAFSTVILNFTLNYFLIPVYGCIGAAFAALMTQLYVATTQIIVVRKIFAFHADFKFVLNLLLFSAAVLLISFGVKYLPADWKVQLVLAGTLGLLSAFIFRLFETKKIMTLIKLSGEE